MRSADTREKTPPRPSGNSASATPPHAGSLVERASDAPPMRDAIRLLLQSPSKLFLYWTHAHDPQATLRAAFAEFAEPYELVVRLVKVDTGEEFLLPASPDRMQWFEVYPSHIYRADVGFHAAGRSFLRLLSSNVVKTPPDAISQVTDAAPQFQLGAREFARALNEAGYERYAATLAPDELSHSRQDAPVAEAAERPARAQVDAAAPDEYPHH